MMSENEFYELQGDAYRGSKYANFAGGGVTPQGNVSSAVTENNANLVGTSADAADAAPTPVSEGLTAELPSTSDLVIGGALPYAGKAVGEAAGAAIGAGADFGTAIGEGISNLAGKVSGGLIGTTGAGSTATNAALKGLGGQFGPATSAQVTNAAGGAASKLGSSINFGGAAGAGIAAAATTLLTGGNLKDAAKSGVGTAVGTAIGSAFGPIGGFVGGTIGGMLGGRVICTQLVRDGLLEKSDQLLDMEFTFRALSHIHVRGYLFWGKPWVRHMRKSERARRYTLAVVKWRLDEIKYQMGLRDKPDYRGKIVRFIGENACFIIGLFLKDTKETVIYRKDNENARYAE